MNKSYSLIHCHSYYSNGTLLDSTTSPKRMINFAKEKGLKNLVFTEHGHMLSWYKKYKELAENGYKYIHAMEGYICESLDDKENYHILVYAMNKEGMYELNELMSTSYQRDGHFYHRPRFTIDELLELKNVIVSTSCMASIFSQEGLGIFNRLINEFDRNKIFVEIQPHGHELQIKTNELAIQAHEQLGLKIIASNDVHNSDEVTKIGRDLLQKQRGMNYSDEDAFDISLKSYEEILQMFDDIGMDRRYSEMALENTNILCDMCEPIELDYSFKYPKVYDNPTEEILKRCFDGISRLGVNEYIYSQRVLEEIETYQTVHAEDYILLFSDWINDCKKDGAQAGYSRGSCSGSLIAYLLGVIEVDPIMFNTNFFRFLNPFRVSLSDIDVDWGEKDRVIAKNWFYTRDYLNCADIITFGTFGEKSSIEALCRVHGYSDSEFYKNMSSSERENHKEFFEDVESLDGCVRSIGRHPAGILVSTEDIRRTIGIITMEDKDTKEILSVSQLNMKDLDALNYVKCDCLGLANIGAINDTFRSIGDERLSPQTINADDDLVWEHMKVSPFSIFQFENEVAHTRLSTALSNIHDAERIQIMSMMSGLIRPSGASIIDGYQAGGKYIWGHTAIDEYFKNNSGLVTYQEDIMNFLTEFCGYSPAESDMVRRAIGKKDPEAVERAVIEIRDRFMNHFPSKFDCDVELAKDIIERFLIVVDASKNYGFSYNHALPYSFIGYIGAYLRLYYPKQYVTSVINNFIDDHEKVKSAYQYVREHTNIIIQKPKLGFSSSQYSFDKNENIIYEGLGSYKALSSNAVENISKIESADKFDNDFISFLIHISENEIQIGHSNINILIETDFFRDFGKQESLLKCADMFFKTKKYDKKQKDKTKQDKIKFYYESMEELGWELDRHELYKAYSELKIKNSTDIKVQIDATLFYVSNYEKKFNKFLVSGYNLKTETNQVWWSKSVDFKKGDMIQLLETEIKPKKKKIDGKWVTMENDFNYNLIDSTVVMTKK